MATYIDTFVVYSAGSLKKTASGDTLQLTGNFHIEDGAYDLDIKSHDGTNGLKLAGAIVTSTAAELNVLDGITATTAELNILDGVTATAAELNILDGVTSTADELNILDGVTATATELNYLAGITLGTSASSKVVTADASGNVTLSGNLTVNGTTTTIASTNTTIADNLLELNSGAASNANDSGIIIERGSTGDNAIIAWDESADGFVLGTTTATASSTGDLAITAGALSIGSLTLGGTSVTSTAAELNILDGVTATAAELNILDGATLDVNELNILDGVTATTAELNILDGDTSASSITVVDADRIVMNDDGTMKQVAASTLKSYFQSNVTATAIAADDITAGDAAVEITTTSGDVVVDAPTGQSVDLQVNGGNVVEVAATRVDMSQTLILADTSAGGGLELSVSGTYGSAIAVGDIVGLGTGATGGLELADADGSVSDPIGVALGASSASTADDIMVHTLFGARVQVTSNASITPGKGTFLYLDTNAGKVTDTAPSSGKVWRLGITAQDYSAGATSLNIIWMPQFIADLG